MKPHAPPPSASLNAVYARCLGLTLGLSLLYACTPLELGVAPTAECVSPDECGAGKRCVEGLCRSIAYETCNDQDDDLDGEVDEGTLNACGACGAPPAELCDDLDNDCDGLIDETFTAKNTPCATSVQGQQATGTWVCLNNTIRCVATQVARPEECNGQDDDLDGEVDEDVSLVEISCPPNSCRARALSRCEEGVPVNNCLEQIASSDALCDGVDEDCDGAVDEDAIEAPRSCAPDLNNTKGCTLEASRVCTGGEWLDSECDRLREETPELCDQLDNNCDGLIDEPSELVPSPELPLSDRLGEPCQQGACAAEYRFFCVDGAEYIRCTNNLSYDPTSTEADPFDPEVAAVLRDWCGAGDEDCDGAVDEDSLPTPSLCPDGVTQGAWVCLEAPVLVDMGEDPPNPPTARQRVLSGCETPYQEECNGLDDDLDGAVDEAASGEASEPSVCVCPPWDQPDAEARDENCDGLDGLVTGAIFVSAEFGDDERGTGAYLSPVATLSVALNRARSLTLNEEGRLNERSPDLYIAAGDYTWSNASWNQDTSSSLRLYGGYLVTRNEETGALEWRRPSLAEASTLGGEAHTTLQVPASLLSFALARPEVDLTLQRLSIEVASSLSTLNPSVTGAAFMTCSSATLSDVRFVVGDGGLGRDGLNASPSAISPVEARGRSPEGFLPGAGGTNNLCCARGECSGGLGGAPERDGESGAPFIPEGNIGRGGDGGLLEAIIPHGGEGEPGRNGASAVPASAPWGYVPFSPLSNLEPSRWYIWRHRVPLNEPSAGAPGGGGGGGGGSPPLSPVAPSAGAGGGAGGCGGAPGQSATSGGSSVGLIVGSRCTISFERVEVVTGAGGRGGRGGQGASGMAGAPGGLGTLALGTGESGDGGSGGRGGCGGHGVSGHGGSSIGVVLVGDAAQNGALPPGVSVALGAPGQAGDPVVPRDLDCGVGQTGTPGASLEVLCCPLENNDQGVFEGCEPCPVTP